MPQLTITSGSLAGQKFSFSGPVVIGRGAYADIRIDDSTVSRRHAEIISGPDNCWRIRDLGSANGTLFDGKPVRGELVVDGSIDIVFGEVATTIRIAEPLESNDTGKRSFPHLLDRLELLASITSLLARREDPAQLIGQILEMMLAGFDGCQRVGLFVKRPGSSNLTRHASRNRPCVSDQASSAMLAQACLRHVDGVAGGKAALEPFGITDASASILAAPVIFGGETLGVIVAESERADTWNSMDRSLAKGIASVLAGLVDAERGNHPDRRVAERDLLLARRVQQHFLPHTSLRLPGYEVAEAYVPARVVGGDHYDYCLFADDRVGLVIADVSGKAVSAALVMARFGMAVRLLASQASNPLDLLVTLNVLLLDELEPGMFVTAQIAALHPETGEMEIANAGHPAPLLRAADGKVTALGLEPGAPLGANAQTLFVAKRITLERGACLMLYSDGLDEAENEAGAQFGIERACTILARHPDAPSALAEINRELAAFVGSAPPADDLTLLLVSRDRNQ